MIDSAQWAHLMKRCVFQISFICHPGRYVACLRADFWRRINRNQNRFLFILRFPCDKKIACWSVIAPFVKYFYTMLFWYSKRCCRHDNRHTSIVTVCNAIFYPIPSCHAFKFSQNSTLNLDSCWCFDMFYYPTFLIHQNVCMDLRWRCVLFKIDVLVEIKRKIGGGEEKVFFRFVD